MKARQPYHHDAERAAGVAGQLVPDSRKKRLDGISKCKKSEQPRAAGCKRMSNQAEPTRKPKTRKNHAEKTNRTTACPLPPNIWARVMDHFYKGITILACLLLFQVWNIATARKHGKIFLTFSTYLKEREPREFRVAFLLNLIWSVVIAIVTLIYVIKHFGFKL